MPVIQSGDQRIMGLVLSIRTFHPQVMSFSFDVKKIDGRKGGSPTGNQFLMSGCQHLMTSESPFGALVVSFFMAVQSEKGKI